MSDGKDPSRRRVTLLSTVAHYGMHHLTPLEQDFEVVAAHGIDDGPNEALLVHALDGAWASVAGPEPYTRRMFERLPHLRVIARCGVGVDNIDLEAATEHDVAVLTTPGANSDAVADHSVALMLAVTKRLSLLDASVRAGAWRPPAPIGDLSGSTVGLLGFGDIGQRVAARLRGFDTDLVGYDLAPDQRAAERLGVRMTSAEGVMAAAEILSVHLPLTEATRNFVDRQLLAKLPPQAIVINTARGGIVDEDALYDAVASGALGGCGLDVFGIEPLRTDSPLLTLPTDRVVLSGHAASLTDRSIRLMLEGVTTNLLAAAGRGVPLYVANPGHSSSAVEEGTNIHEPET